MPSIPSNKANFPVYVSLRPLFLEFTLTPQSWPPMMSGCKTSMVRHVFPLFLVHLSFSDAIFSVEMITLGFFPPTSYASLAYNGPGFQTGLDVVQREFGGVFSISQVILHELTVKDCLDLSMQCDDMAGRYFYRRTTTPNLTVFIVPGTWSPFYFLPSLGMIYWFRR